MEWFQGRALGGVQGRRPWPYSFTAPVMEDT